MPILEDVRDHLKRLIAGHEAEKAEAQVKLDAVEAELARAPTAQDLLDLARKIPAA